MLHIESINIPESWVAVLIGNTPSLLIDALKLKRKCSCKVCIVGHLPFLRNGELWDVRYRRIKCNHIWLSHALREIITFYHDRIVAIVYVGESYIEPMYRLRDRLEHDAVILDPHLKSVTTNF